jgi:6-phosphogluconolactonase
MRKKAVLFAAVVTALLAVVAPAANADGGDTARGAVYALTNSTSGNGVAYYARSASGALTYVATYATGGNGTGAGLGSQGAVAVAGDTLFAVNAGSDSISAFAVHGGALNLETTFSSNGVRPISVTVHGNLLYVLNAGGSGSITGFRLAGGDVEALDGSTQPLLGTNPAQISFSPDGSTLVVTEKGSQTIDTFSVGRHGIAQPGVSSPSAGATPFGFAFDNRGRAFVSEAAGSASSYSIDTAGAQLITGPVLTHQAAPCWLVVTKNGRFAYTANAGAGSISGFSIGADGSIALLDPSTGVTVNLGAGSHPLDEAVSEDGRFLYVLVDGRHTIAGFSIGVDGSLTPVGEVGTLPAGAIGLASL